MARNWSARFPLHCRVQFSPPHPHAGRTGIVTGYEPLPKLHGNDKYPKVTLDDPDRKIVTYITTLGAARRITDEPPGRDERGERETV